jgi:transcriptional regulator with XRE-family HTH domain
MEDFSKVNALIKLAKQVKKLRKEKGVSQQNAYNDTGIHFARIEQGKRDVSYTTLIKICAYFDISLKDFFN